jgi:hypothetical protein
MIPALLIASLAPAPASGQGRGRGREPTIPPPSIMEYKPHSTLVVPEHEVPRAKFPVVDLHGHPPFLGSPDVIRNVVKEMDALNLQVIVQANPSSGDRLKQQIAAVNAAGYADRFVFFASLDLRDVGPGSGKKIAAQLEEDVKAGAAGIGEIMKSFGLSYR